jgi:hypothetical protein
MDIKQIKESLYNWGLFTPDELETLKLSELKYTCDCCNHKSNRVNLLEECKNKMKICFSCLENYFDNTDHNISNSNILFVCCCCNENIKNYRCIT